MNSRIPILLIAFSFMLSSCGKNPVGPVDYSDGEYILFIRNTYRQSAAMSEICTMRPDGSDLRVIACQDDLVSPFERGRWSPDKSLMVVEIGFMEWRPLWLMDMKGNVLKELVWAGRRPLWTPDGNSVIYYRRRGFYAEINDIYMVDIHSLEEDTLIIAENYPETQSFYHYILLDLFPEQSTKLLLNETYVFRDSSGTQYTDDDEIISYDYLNNQKIYLTNNNLQEGVARISPDNSIIAYSIRNVGSLRYTDNLYLMTVAGGSIRRVTVGPDTEFYSSFAWSPDGNSLVYAKAENSEESHNFYDDIFTLEIKTTTEKRLTNTVQDNIAYYIMDWR